MTLNSEYLDACRTLSNTQLLDSDDPIVKTFNDFGDVRYGGSKYLAFTNWWRTKLGRHETKGTYLFAEPVTSSVVSVVTNKVDAELVINDPNGLLVNIPKNLNRRQIDSALNSIFKTQLTFDKGRQARNPSKSLARYKLSKSVQADSLKSAFSIMEAENEAVRMGIKLSNLQLADKLGLKVKISEATRQEQSELAAYEAYLISTTVSRKKKVAKAAIKNAALGLFP